MQEFHVVRRARHIAPSGPHGGMGGGPRTARSVFFAKRPLDLGVTAAMTWSQSAFRSAGCVRSSLPLAPYGDEQDNGMGGRRDNDDVVLSSGESAWRIVAGSSTDGNANSDSFVSIDAAPFKSARIWLLRTDCGRCRGAGACRKKSCAVFRAPQSCGARRRHWHRAPHG
ncbi:hypothetical protein EV130_106330 [Rhizobium azibense]|uniref:Uncharacterized protein n=1 Tax=Rhizobium azibense TaxID=1136135 RepID=A0A4R3QTX7_9HYPH|nr:hypothetical protein EV130_106330 [Rhizobium azibense]TCU39483.1 hypothetical protein EV129_103330 [Rhizobium azibense]